MIIERGIIKQRAYQPYHGNQTNSTIDDSKLCQLLYCKDKLPVWQPPTLASTHESSRVAVVAGCEEDDEEEEGEDMTEGDDTTEGVNRTPPLLSGDEASL